MEKLADDNRDVVVEVLKEDQERNINILNFIESYGMHDCLRVGNSVLVRGVSDRPWVFISSNSQAELSRLANKLNQEDVYFAAIEEWMISTLSDHRIVVWDLSMIQFILPENVHLPEPEYRNHSLKIDDASYVYQNSEYQDYLSIEYIKDRIARGPSAAVYEKDQLVAWALTQDDGAIGALHVLEHHRNRGYGYRILLALSEQLGNQGKTPFAYVEKDNVKAMRLVKKLGFIEQKPVHWFQLA